MNKSSFNLWMPVHLSLLPLLLCFPQLGVEVAEVSDRCVTLSDGRVIRDVDAILMGTGYTAPVHDPKLKLDDDRKYFMRVSAPDRESVLPFKKTGLNDID